MAFERAQKKNAKLRLAISGVSGGGKTFSALQLAKEFGKKIAVIDSERGSASLYADVFEFDVSEMEGASLTAYREKIQEAAEAGYEVLVIDSYSHSWLDVLDKIDKAGGWKSKVGQSVSPETARLVQAVLTYPGHVIATFRSKMEYNYDKDDKTGKGTVRKIGLAPVARPDTEYEFTVWLEVTREGALTVSKTRCSALNEPVYNRDTDIPKIAKTLKAWLNSGKELTPAEKMAERIKFAQSKEALEALGPEIVAMSVEHKTALRPVYAARMADLAQASAGADEP